MQPKFCTKCGNTLKEGDKFCRKCGAPIKIPGAAVPAAPAAPARPAAPAAPPVRPKANIPSYDEVKRRLDRPVNNQQFAEYDNPEGTVLLGGASVSPGMGNTVKKASITLSLEEMLRGCSKVVDFGTGKRYELIIPAGLSPGDKIIVDNTGITDPESGALCDFELTTVIG